MVSFEQIEEYAERHTRELSALHPRLWQETHEKTDFPGMMVGPLEGALLRLPGRLTSAKRVLEIGMFTGYSALAMAEALPENGRLITCDVNVETTAIAKRYFATSPHGHKIEIKLGPARETLKALKGTFDLCFIDADKESYGDYYDRAVDLVRREERRRRLPLPFRRSLRPLQRVPCEQRQATVSSACGKRSRRQWPDSIARCLGWFPTVPFASASASTHADASG